MNYWLIVIVLFMIACILMLVFHRLKIINNYFVSTVATLVTLLLLIIFSLFVIAAKAYPLMDRWAQESSKNYLELIPYVLSQDSTYLYAATFAGLAGLYLTMESRWLHLKRRRMIENRIKYRKRKEQFEEDYRLRKKVMKIQQKTIKSLTNELLK